MKQNHWDTFLRFQSGYVYWALNCPWSVEHCAKYGPIHQKSSIHQGSLSGLIHWDPSPRCFICLLCEFQISSRLSKLPIMPIISALYEYLFWSRRENSWKYTKFLEGRSLFRLVPCYAQLNWSLCFWKCRSELGIKKVIFMQTQFPVPYQCDKKVVK